MMMPGLVGAWLLRPHIRSATRDLPVAQAQRGRRAVECRCQCQGYVVEELQLDRDLPFMAARGQLV